MNSESGNITLFALFTLAASLIAMTALASLISGELRAIQSIFKKGLVHMDRHYLLDSLSVELLNATWVQSNGDIEFKNQDDDLFQYDVKSNTIRRRFTRVGNTRPWTRYVYKTEDATRLRIHTDNGQYIQLELCFEDGCDYQWFWVPNRQ